MNGSGNKAVGIWLFWGSWWWSGKETRLVLVAVLRCAVLCCHFARTILLRWPDELRILCSKLKWAVYWYWLFKKLTFTNPAPCYSTERPCFLHKSSHGGTLDKLSGVQGMTCHEKVGHNVVICSAWVTCSVCASSIVCHYSQSLHHAQILTQKELNGMTPGEKVLHNAVVCSAWVALWAMPNLSLINTHHYWWPCDNQLAPLYLCLREIVKSVGGAEKSFTYVGCLSEHGHTHTL